MGCCGQATCCTVANQCCPSQACCNSASDKVAYACQGGAPCCNQASCCAQGTYGACSCCGRDAACCQGSRCREIRKTRQDTTKFKRFMPVPPIYIKSQFEVRLLHVKPKFERYKFHWMKK